MSDIPKATSLNEGQQFQKPKTSRFGRPAQKRCLLYLCLCVSILLPFVSGCSFQWKTAPGIVYFYFFFISQTDLNEIKGSDWKCIFKKGGKGNGNPVAIDRELGCAEGGGYDPAIFLPPPKKGLEEGKTTAVWPFNLSARNRIRGKRDLIPYMGGEFRGLMLAVTRSLLPMPSLTGADQRLYTIWRPASQRTLHNNIVNRSMCSI